MQNIGFTVAFFIKIGKQKRLAGNEQEELTGRIDEVKSTKTPGKHLCQSNINLRNFLFILTCPALPVWLHLGCNFVRTKI